MNRPHTFPDAGECTPGRSVALMIVLLSLTCVTELVSYSLREGLCTLICVLPCGLGTGLLVSVSISVNVIQVQKLKSDGRSGGRECENGRDGRNRRHDSSTVELEGTENERMWFLASDWADVEGGCCQPLQAMIGAENWWHG